MRDDINAMTADRPVHPAGEATSADCMALALWAAAPDWPVTDPAGPTQLTVATPNPLAAAVLGDPPTWSVLVTGAITMELRVPEAVPVGGDTFDGIVTALQGLAVLPPPRR